MAFLPGVGYAATTLPLRVSDVPELSADPHCQTVPLAEFTTLRLGGPAHRLLAPTSAEEIAQSVRDATVDGARTLVLGGGSNVVIADQGFPGTVILVRSRGIRVTGMHGDTVTIEVAAGEPWDEVVTTAVTADWSGLECLAGIPGSAGATPMQNVNAYGQEVAETITAVEVLDRVSGTVSRMGPTECRFGYRSSLFRGSDRWVVLSVEFRLRRSPASAPVRYPELARALGVELGAQAPLAEVRQAVLGLRAGKGMLLDPADPDSCSAGSFFINPVLTADEVTRLRGRLDGAPEPSLHATADGRFKVSAAWLIERAGFAKGYGLGAVSISSKHALALTNRGGGSSEELLRLARQIRDGVRARFGVTLVPEPVLVECQL
ncbi:UDP-N-acetylmuramate dehydrogenase [Natronosporangium hydrolyticum]|uniref:UDP-N-acetylenolpyruvoylglucosamine reductase n=1 Tax=Natronosporangium hydrolyticum TaxID=2811111 RepID=A0A895YAS8_9ACTN|nr:UDP-N-acetylmuramate dehydrogenase [Natronosporangium hydrolyticum]QSB14501.1 UDP-N-acetylmuramate dehydrogenase [Natronosporangium hydrolyticum]